MNIIIVIVLVAAAGVYLHRMHALSTRLDIPLLQLMTPFLNDWCLIKVAKINKLWFFVSITKYIFIIAYIIFALGMLAGPYLGESLEKLIAPLLHYVVLFTIALAFNPMGIAALLFLMYGHVYIASKFNKELEVVAPRTTINQ